VISGFAWHVAAANNTLPLELYLDDIVWE
jgi:hypothetical protein